MKFQEFIQYPPSLEEWLKNAKSLYEPQLESPTKIVGLIGQDYPDHGKTENINCFLGETIFPVYTSPDETLSIRAHFSEKNSILFLAMNGLDDVENLRSVFGSLDKNEQSFFEKLAESENVQNRMLHFLFISCHFIIYFEKTSRIDMDFFRTLKKVNSIRINLRSRVGEKLDLAGLKNVWFSNKVPNTNEKEGRAVLPRLIIALQRNNVRTDLGSAKKREVYEKLEKSLENQVDGMLKSFKLTENGYDSLCQLNQNLPFAHLINPETIQRNVLEEMLEVLLQDADKRETPKLPTNSSFCKFLEDNFRSEKNSAKLEDVIDVLTCFLDVLNGTLEKDSRLKLEDINIGYCLEKKLYQDHLQEAFRIYEKDSTSRNLSRRDVYNPTRNQIRTKAEHDAKFSEAVQFLKSVVGYKLGSALEVLQKKCDEIWQTDLKACEQISLTGVPCAKKVHPTFGDSAHPEYKWTTHESPDTIISTCLCGVSQAIRNDPFTLKEANYDFYENNLDFVCCRRLEKTKFQVYRGEEEEEKEEWTDWDDRESNSLREMKKGMKKLNLLEPVYGDEDEQDDPNESADVFGEDGHSQKSDDYSMLESTDSSSISDDIYMEKRRNGSSASGNVKSSRDLAIEYARKLNALKLSDTDDLFIEGVPNTLTAGKLPLFPSWFLTCIGDSNIYSHSEGLRKQPNFKIGGEYLTPTIVHVNCDIDVWNRDLGKMRNDEYKQYIKPKTIDDVAKVKFFVGFEYECSRGHRFFVDHNGEPLLYRNRANVVRDSSGRNSLSEILLSDLPLRRACTCKKPPLKSAQLTKVHVVTPKAPVHITINPQVEVPGHQGQYITGQGPLELAHSKYYILQLPMVYSGPSGTYIHDPKKLDKVGIWKGGAINVVHKPMVSFRWC